jgi:tripartite-type tricarboxylate transporter receptor subunit TctC
MLAGGSGMALAPILEIDAARAADGEFPDRPIRLVVGYTPGGGVDVLMRVLATCASRLLSQPVIVENKPGLAGALGPSQMAATARPDGYSVAMLVPNVFRQPLLGSANYDPINDFTHILRVCGLSAGIVTRPDAPWQDWKGLVTYARANPDRVAYATAGINSTQHLTMEQICRNLDIRMLHVPYKGASEEYNALLAGDVQLVAEVGSWSAMVESGQFRLLITWGTERMRRFPAVPTLREEGIGVTYESSLGIGGPKGMPAAVVSKLHDTFRKAMEDLEFVAVLDRLEMFPAYLGGNDYRESARGFIEQQRALLQSMGLTVGIVR